MSNTSGWLFLRGWAGGKIVAGRAYSSRHAARPELPVLARPDQWRCGSWSRLCWPRWRQCRRRSTYTARSTWPSATLSAKCPSGSAPRRGARGRGEHSGEARARSQPAPGTAVGKGEAGEMGGPSGRSVRLERGEPVSAFTSALVAWARTLK